MLFFSRLVVRICFGFWILSFGFTAPAVAMGSIPTTTEVLVPTIDVVREFGRPGSGDRQFYYPQDVDAALVGDLSTGLGNVFVADTGNNRVERLDEDGTFVYQFGKFGADHGQFNTPVGIAVDFNNRLYVSERDNDRVQLFDIRGNYMRDVATAEVSYRKLLDPAGMDVDLWGNLYVADSGNDRILKYDDAGNFMGLDYKNLPTGRQRGLLYYFIDEAKAEGVMIRKGAPFYFNKLAVVYDAQPGLLSGTFVETLTNSITGENDWTEQA